MVFPTRGSSYGEQYVIDNPKWEVIEDPVFEVELSKRFGSFAQQLGKRITVEGLTSVEDSGTPVIEVKDQYFQLDCLSPSEWGRKSPAIRAWTWPDFNFDKLVRATGTLALVGQEEYPPKKPYPDAAASVSKKELILLDCDFEILSNSKVEAHLGKKVTIDARAQSWDEGAIITWNGADIFIDNLKEWPESVFGKIVRVTGILSKRKILPDPEVNPASIDKANEFSAKFIMDGRAFGKQYVIEDPKWQVLNEQKANDSKIKDR
jgi:hypothetical protein